MPPERANLPDPPAVRVIMTPVSHRRAITHEVIGIPGDDVRLPRGNLRAAGRAQVLLLGAVRRNIAHKPLRPAMGLLAGTTIGQAGDIGGRVLCSPLVLIDPTIARHQSDHHQ